MLKNLKNRIMLLGMSLAGIINPVFAQNDAQDKPIINVDPQGLINDASGGTKRMAGLLEILKVLVTVMQYVSAAGIIVSIIMLIWCGIQMASSAGNPQKRAMAMEGIKSTLIAAIIIGAASTIATIAFRLLR